LKTAVRQGQQLVIPRAPALLLAARADNPPPVAESYSLDPAVASSASTPLPEKSNQSKLVYLVKRGDTLSSIARLYRTTVASLKTWNRMRSNALRVGQRLTIFTIRQPLGAD
jgi:LysM repeat protein